MNVSIHRLMCALVCAFAVNGTACAIILGAAYHVTVSELTSELNDANATIIDLTERTSKVKVLGDRLNAEQAWASMFREWELLQTVSELTSELNAANATNLEMKEAPQ